LVFSKIRRIDRDELSLSPQVRCFSPFARFQHLIASPFN